MKFTNFKISRESIFPIENITHVRSCKTFYHISVHFRYPGFRSVSKPRKPVLIFRTGPTTTVKWYQLGQSCYEDKIQELNTDFAKICISPKSSGLLWSRFLFQFLKNWNIRQDRIFPLSILLLPLPRRPLSVMSLWRSVNIA